MSKVYYNEQGFVDLLKDILENGVKIPDRTGVGCYAVFDRKLVYNVGKVFPFSTIRPAALRLAFEEFWFFLRGETQTKELEKRGVLFWKWNTSRQFLDNRNLKNLHEGDMGKAYGAQFRGFGASQFDQLEDIHNVLRNDPLSRRMVTTIWNPAESHMMALTPCWWAHQFVVLPDKNGDNTLHMKLINRSLDALFGATFAIQQYALYMVAVAQVYGLKVGDLSCDLTHVHLYENQIEFTKETVTRDLGTPGQLSITKPLRSLDDILEMEWTDVLVKGLVANENPYKTPRPHMAV